MAPSIYPWYDWVPVIWSYSSPGSKNCSAASDKSAQYQNYRICLLCCELDPADFSSVDFNAAASAADGSFMILSSCK